MSPLVARHQACGRKKRAQAGARAAAAVTRCRSAVTPGRTSEQLRHCAGMRAIGRSRRRAGCRQTGGTRSGGRRVWRCPPQTRALAVAGTGRDSAARQQARAARMAASTVCIRVQELAATSITLARRWWRRRGQPWREKISATAWHYRPRTPWARHTRHTSPWARLDHPRIYS